MEELLNAVKALIEIDDDTGIFDCYAEECEVWRSEALSRVMDDLREAINDESQLTTSARTD